MQANRLAEQRNISNLFRKLEEDISKEKRFLALPLQNWREITKPLLCHVIFELTLSRVLNKPELCDEPLRRDISKSLLKFVLGELKAYEKPDIDIDTGLLLARRTHSEVDSLDQLSLGHLRGILAPLRNAQPASPQVLPGLVELLISYVEKTETLINSIPDAAPLQHRLC
jgi:hypothetical protein